MYVVQRAVGEPEVYVMAGSEEERQDFLGHVAARATGLDDKKVATAIIRTSLGDAAHAYDGMKRKKPAWPPLDLIDIKASSEGNEVLFSEVTKENALVKLAEAACGLSITVDEAKAQAKTLDKYGHAEGNIVTVTPEGLLAEDDFLPQVEENILARTDIGHRPITLVEDLTGVNSIESQIAKSSGLTAMAEQLEMLPSSDYHEPPVFLSDRSHYQLGTINDGQFAPVLSILSKEHPVRRSIVESAYQIVEIYSPVSPTYPTP